MAENKDVVEKLTFIVLLENRQKIVHTYDIPSTLAEVKALMKQMIEMITWALGRGNKKAFLYLKNPDICYNPDKILGVELSEITKGAIEEAISEAQRKTVGFVKRKSSS